MYLSIITPYYNTLEYTKRLAKVLAPQLTDKIEWIIVDDGCNEKELDNLKATVIHLKENSGAAGKPRNIGLDIATGDYITFIDSDDLVSEDYIYHILRKTKKDPDIIYLSWKGKDREVIMNPRPPRWNCAVWCRVYKRELIEHIRFDETLKIAEDFDFNKRIKADTTMSIKKQIYFYERRKGSLTNG